MASLTVSNIPSPSLSLLERSDEASGRRYMSKWLTESLQVDESVLPETVEELVVEVDGLLLGGADLSALESHEGFSFLLNER